MKTPIIKCGSGTLFLFRGHVLRILDHENSFLQAIFYVHDRNCNCGKVKGEEPIASIGLPSRIRVEVLGDVFPVNPMQVAHLKQNPDGTSATLKRGSRR